LIASGIETLLGYEGIAVRACGAAVRTLHQAEGSNGGGEGVDLLEKGLGCTLPE